MNLQALRPLPLLTLCAALLAGAAHAQTPEGQPQTDLPRATLTVGMHRLDVQLATTPQQQATGLMFRQHMPDSEGMLFIFDEPRTQCFWMRNTLIPLTAAFIDDEGRIVNLADMQPLDESSHCSAKPVRYVLEMNQGWFAQRHVNAGHKLRGSPFASATQAKPAKPAAK